MFRVLYNVFNFSSLFRPIRMFAGERCEKTCITCTDQPLCSDVILLRRATEEGWDTRQEVCFQQAIRFLNVVTAIAQQCKWSN